MHSRCTGETGNAGEVGGALFADLRLRRGILHATVVGPSLGRRQAEVITEMIRRRLDGYEPIARVVLNLADVAHINSAGLSAFLQIRRNAAEHGASLELRSVRSHVREILRIVGLQRVLGLDDRHPIARLGRR